VKSKNFHDSRDWRIVERAELVVGILDHAHENDFLMQNSLLAWRRLCIFIEKNRVCKNPMGKKPMNFATECVIAMQNWMRG
jgi:hypothetical protein